MHPFHRMAENDDKLTHLRLKKIGFQTIETQNVKELNRHIEAQSPAKFISRTADNGKRGPDDKKAAVPSITINCPESEVKLRQRPKSYTGGLMARRDSFKHSDAKIVVMGPRHVGKSAMTVRFLTKRFIGEYDSSKDLFYSHQITIDEELVNLEILDTGPLPDSQDTADRIMESRVIWGDIFLLVYSTTSRKSFNGMRPLHQAICAIKPHSLIMIVGNKQDLKQNRRVKKSEGEQLAFELKCPFWECSFPNDPSFGFGKNCSVVTFFWDSSSTMSGGLEALQLKEEDVVKFLAASVHLGSTNIDFQMQQYVYKKKQDGIPIINIKKTWEKLLLAARIIVSIENPADVCVISARPYGQRAVLKFANSTGATAIAGRFTPGTFTNQIQAAFREPRLLVVCDSRTDHQSVTEASYVNIPVIAFCNTDSPLKHVDVAIPCNNKGAYSIGLMWWMLAREVLRMRGTISRLHPWEVMPDLYFYRDPEDAEKEEQDRLARATEEPQPSYPSEWGGGAAPADQGMAPVTDWSAEGPSTGVIEWGSEAVAPSVPVQPGAFGTTPEVTDWGAETTPSGNIEWGAEPKEGQENWGGAAGAEWA